MKKIMFWATLMLSFVFVTNVQAQKNEKEIRAAATSVTSRTPGIDGAKNFKDFCNGDTKFELSKNSPKGMRKAAVRMSHDLYKKGMISYKEHLSLAEKLACKPGRK